MKQTEYLFTNGDIKILMMLTSEDLRGTWTVLCCCVFVVCLFYLLLSLFCFPLFKFFLELRVSAKRRTYVSRITEHMTVLLLLRSVTIDLFYVFCVMNQMKYSISIHDKSK